MYHKKKVLLGGFNKKQILLLKKENKKIIFYKHKENQKKINKIDAFVSINRRSFENALSSCSSSFSSTKRMFYIAGAGIDKYFRNNELSKKCNVTSMKILQGPQVADHAMGLLLCLTRNINLVIKNGPFHKFKNRAIELRNKNALIIGYGGVGKCVAERARGFGLNVDVIDPHYSPISNVINNFYLVEEYKKALKDKDVIFYTSPLTIKTGKMFNEGIVKYIKKGAFIINVSRGAVMCYDTLYKYLKNNHLRGAGSDVIDVEPIKKNHKLLKLSNFIFTPHIAGTSDRLSGRNFKLIESNISRFANNGELINLVNIRRGY